MSTNDTSKDIDTSKICQEKSKTRRELIKIDTNTDSSVAYLFGLYFDGQKYMTMKIVRNVVGYGHRDRVREGHVRIICEPDSTYFGHAMPVSASSKASFKEIFDRLAARSVDLDSVEVIGCDETVVIFERKWRSY